MAFEDAGSSLRALDWHQGALIPVAPETQLSTLLSKDFEHAVVASQDCDIVAPVTIEAAVDLLPATVTAEPNPQLLHGKHPRQICLALENGQFATVDIRRRATVDKRLLAAIHPIGGASAQVRERKLLAKWLGKRYSRPAFPDAFNERLRTQKAKLEAISKRPQGRGVSAILLQLDTEAELGPGEIYRTAVWFACRPPIAEEPGSRQQIEEYAAAFVAALNACGGVRVDEFEVKSHLDINLDDLEHMKRFDFDYRSEAPSPGGDLSEPVE